MAQRSGEDLERSNISGKGEFLAIPKTNAARKKARHLLYALYQQQQGDYHYSVAD